MSELSLERARSVPKLGKGIILICTFRIVFVPIETEAIAGPLPKLASVRESDKTAP
jgi:hypothetical protein